MKYKFMFKGSSRYKKLIVFGLSIIGVVLTAINVYGEFQQIRPAHFKTEHLRFGEGDSIYSYDEVMEKINQQPVELRDEYAENITSLISKGLAHIRWTKYAPGKYNQLVPIWENYFLFFMGVFTQIPEYKRYHFADYERSLERGIGICGDASMIMSQILNKAEIPNQIVSFPGHVAVEAMINGSLTSYDPDFGVVIPHSIAEINERSDIIFPYYKEEGYTDKEINTLQRSYSNEFMRWDDTEDFITKKYHFENISYLLKWPFPIFLVLLPFLLGYKIFNRKAE
jgi:hypothetical protein